LSALSQGCAASPIHTFSLRRDDVEQLARELIQKDRLEGRELVIRLSDVHGSQPRPAVASSSAEPIALKSTLPDIRNARRMMMSEDARITVWNALCEQQTKQSDVIAGSAPHELASRVIQENGAFTAQSTPETAHVLNLRRVEAGKMVASWKAELFAVPRVAAS